MTWSFWLILGLGLLVFEVLTPGGFFTIFFGLAAFVVGALVRFGILESGASQWLIFAILGTVLIVILRPFVRRRFETGTPKVDQFVGQTAIATEDLHPQGRGKVELRGTTWSAHYIGAVPVLKGARLSVLKVDGISLIVDKEKE